MPEQNPTQAPARHSGPWVTITLVAVLVALFALPLYLSHPAEGEEGFGGTDSQATEIIEKDHGYEPWFKPVFEPGSGEVESGLFALQAAIGAGVVGYAFGRLHQRSITRGKDDRAVDAAPASEG